MPPQLTYYCWHCYGENRSNHGPCGRCGRPIEAPADAGYVDCLLWALEHPVAERRMFAAQVLGELGEPRASDRLVVLARSSDDPFLAAQALRSLIEIEGVEQLAELLAELAAAAPIGPRRIAEDALASRRAPKR
jgi:HEAT repeat protein